MKKRKPRKLSQIVHKYYPKTARFAQIITEQVGISDELEPIKIVKDLIVRDHRGFRLYANSKNDMDVWEQIICLPAKDSLVALD